MNKDNSAIDLGDLAEDSITGFRGVVACKSQWLNGCVRVSLQPQKLDKDGKPRAMESFDIEQLKLVKKKVEPVKQPSGGPCDDPLPRAMPARGR